MSDRSAGNVSARRRTAALVSLACFAVLAVTLVIILFRHADDLTIGLVGLFVAAAG